MPAGDRFKSWIESTTATWKDEVRGWFGHALETGVEKIFDFFEPDLRDELSPLLDRIIQTPDLPSDITSIFQKAKTSPQAIQFAFLVPLLVGIVIGAAFGLMQPFMKLVMYPVNRIAKPFRFDPNIVTNAWLRDKTKYEYLFNDLKDLGFNDNRIDTIKELAKRIHDGMQLVLLWRRDNSRELELSTEFAKLGYSSNQWEDFKKLTTVLPSASDIVRFAVREVYTPEVAKKYGQYADFPEVAMTDAQKIGFDRDLLTKYWAAHWDLPSASAGYEMLHRGIISYSELELLLRTLDVMPFWRDKMIQIAYTPYTRVDARRMWDMGVLNDADLKKSYTDIGYDNEHANQMVIWTKVYQTFPDLIARYKNGYINLVDVRLELKALGVTDKVAEWLIETKIKKAEPERVAKERDLTKAEIIKGLYKGVIDEPTATQLLVDMGYDENEAKFIIVINMPKEETKAAQTEKQLTKTDVISGLKKGLITESDAIARLVAIRYTPDDAAYLVQIAQATTTTVAEPKERELTKAEIVKGVKVGLITAEEGYLMLQDIGYNADNAAFILMISVPELGGSPDSYADFKALTQSYRASQGLSSKPVPPELQQAERELIAAKAALDYAKAHKIADAEIVKLESNVNSATLAFKQLLAKYLETKA